MSKPSPDWLARRYGGTALRPATFAWPPRAEIALMLLKRYFARVSGASISPVCEFTLRFVRTVILSRLLMPDDLGAAVALVTILTSCEVITDVGVDKFIIVNSGEQRAQAVAAAQEIIVIRALVIALAIAIFAPALASIFGAAAHVGSIRWLGAVPVLRSLRNLRIVQIQQDYRYGPEAVANVVGQLGAVVIIVPAALWFEDERAMLASLLAEAALYAVMSHLLVPRERVRSVNPTMRRAALTYGLPLMVNGVGLMALAQFDRAVVANLFSLATLALYSLALAIAIVPTSVLQRVAGNLSIPFLADARANPKTSREASLIVVLASAIGAAAYAVGIALFLQKFVPLLYGSRYTVSSAFCALAAIVVFLRVARGGVNLVLLAHSKTARLTVGNIMGGIGLIAGFLLALWSQRVEAVVLGTLIGDLLSLIVLCVLARRYLPMGSTLGHGSVLGLTVLASAFASVEIAGTGWGIRFLFFAAGMVVITADAGLVYWRVVAEFLRARRVSSRELPNQLPAQNTILLEDKF